MHPYTVFYRFHDVLRYISVYEDCVFDFADICDKIIENYAKNNQHILKCHTS